MLDKVLVVLAIPDARLSEGVCVGFWLFGVPRGLLFVLDGGELTRPFAPAWGVTQPPPQFR